MESTASSPLRAYKEKIDETKAEIDIAIQSLNKVIYPSVRDCLRLSGEYYKKGLDDLWLLLNEVILARAAYLRTRLQEKQKGVVPLDFLLNKHWSTQLNTAYQIIERLRTDYLSAQVQSSLPPEIYLWAYDMTESMGIRRDQPRVPIVFQESMEFANRTFEYMIRSPMEPLYDLAKTPFMEGTLVPAKPLTGLAHIPKGHVILYISGESKKITLWPAIVHEVFHILQTETNWIKSFQTYCAQRDWPNIILHENQYLNNAWIEEIMMDLMSLYYFGPMFSFSLLKYLQMLPYPSNATYPQMNSRLYVARKHLETVQLSAANPKAKKYPIVQQCISRFKPTIDEYLKAEEKELSKRNQQLDSLYDAMKAWLTTVEMKTFFNIIDDYEKEASDYNPKLDYDEIKDYVFRLLVPPAVHPNILLNVVLAEYDSYSPQRHYQIVVDSIRNWKVTQIWRQVES